MKLNRYWKKITEYFEEVGFPLYEVADENGTAVTTSYSITSGANAMTAGPVSIGTAATVTVPVGSEWTIV